MELLKKRGTAIAVFVVIVIAFTLIGCHRSLGRACRQVEEAFFTRGMLSDYGAYTAPADQLENCVRLSNRLLSVINDEAHAAHYEAVLEARQALDDALASRRIGAIYDANAALVAAVSALDEQVGSTGAAGLPLSSDDYGAIIQDLNSAQRVLNESPYNDYAETFIEETVRRFPTDILRVLSFTALPEKFE